VKSLCKWCLVGVITVTVLSVLVGTPGGKAQDSGWTTQVIAEGPDASKQRVITPDLDVVGNTVIVGYIDQATDRVLSTFVTSTQGFAKGAQPVTVEVDSGARVNTVRVRDIPLRDGGFRNCWLYIKLGKDGTIEVWVRCADVGVRRSSGDGLQPQVQFLSDPQRLSTEGVPAGQHDLQGDWSGNIDIARDSAKGVFYAVWSENYDTLKAAKSTDGINWTPCGDIPNQSGTDVRFPTIYVDAKGRVYAGATQTAAPDVQAWVSYDGCATWVGPTNVTSNSGFSDAPEFAVIGDKFYSANDDTTTNPNNVDINFSECNVTANAGLANCTGTRGIIKDAAWARMKTDGTNLHVVGNNQGATGFVDYCFSDDGGATWKGEAIPNSRPNNFGVRDPDFGIVISRNNIAVGDDGKVYVVWNTRGDGRSKIMLSVRSAPPAKEGAATCAP
jgi:hypothetical protein